MLNDSCEIHYQQEIKTAVNLYTPNESIDNQMSNVVNLVEFYIT